MQHNFQINVAMTIDDDVFLAIIYEDSKKK